MSIDTLQKSLQIFAKYDKDLFYLLEKDMMSVGSEGLIDEMLSDDIGELIRMGWSYNSDDEFFSFTKKRNK